MPCAVLGHRAGGSTPGRATARGDKRHAVLQLLGGAKKRAGEAASPSSLHHPHVSSQMLTAAILNSLWHGESEKSIPRARIPVYGILERFEATQAQAADTTTELQALCPPFPPPRRGRFPTTERLSNHGVALAYRGARSCLQSAVTSRRFGVRSSI